MASVAQVQNSILDLYDFSDLSKYECINDEYIISTLADYDRVPLKVCKRRLLIYINGRSKHESNTSQ